MASWIVRSTVAIQTDYTKYRPQLRVDFWFTCGYCTIAEVEAAALRFTIDHYQPRERHPELTNVYENLLWCCDTCNVCKGIRPPPAAAAKGYRIFNPDVDDPDAHFTLTGLQLKPLTEFVGHYTIDVLDLNRPNLLRLRELRRRLYGASASIAKGIRNLEGRSIDSLPTKVREDFQRIRKRLTEKAGAATEKLDEQLCKEFNRSVMISDDPPDDARAKERKAYLAKVHAAVPGVLPSPVATKGKRP